MNINLLSEAIRRGLPLTFMIDYHILQRDAFPTNASYKRACKYLDSVGIYNREMLDSPTLHGLSFVNEKCTELYGNPINYHPYRNYTYPVTTIGPKVKFALGLASLSQAARRAVSAAFGHTSLRHAVYDAILCRDGYLVYDKGDAVYLCSDDGMLTNPVPILSYDEFKCLFEPEFREVSDAIRIATSSSAVYQSLLKKIMGSIPAQPSLIELNLFGVRG